MASQPDIKALLGQRLRTIRKIRELILGELGKRSKIGYKHIAAIGWGQKVSSFEAIPAP